MFPPFTGVSLLNFKISVVGLAKLCSPNLAGVTRTLWGNSILIINILIYFICLLCTYGGRDLETKYRLSNVFYTVINIVY